MPRRLALLLSLLAPLLSAGGLPAAAGEAFRITASNALSVPLTVQLEYEGWVGDSRQPLQHAFTLSPGQTQNVTVDCGHQCSYGTLNVLGGTDYVACSAISGPWGGEMTVAVQETEKTRFNILFRCDFGGKDLMQTYSIQGATMH
ncbi:hypothetical protein ACM64Y_18665 [Novispirillum sp. DQ9]|uniref:hypothetical protein n=1 Tax=Novispirillum sp. DQ9 TaxID=3398612 RepID=UPI003C7B62FD